MSGLLRFVASLAIVLVAAATPGYAQEPAGHVKTVSGAAAVVRPSGPPPPDPGGPAGGRGGEPMFATDTLRTAADGAVGVTLKDDTRGSLGPNSEMKVDRYVYTPGEGGLGMVLRFVRGVAVYVSGRMAKLSPDSIRLETPSAIGGVRGTRGAIKVGD